MAANITVTDISPAWPSGSHEASGGILYPVNNMIIYHTLSGSLSNIYTTSDLGNTWSAIPTNEPVALRWYDAVPNPIDSTNFIVSRSSGRGPGRGRFDYLNQRILVSPDVPTGGFTADMAYGNPYLIMTATSSPYFYKWTASPNSSSSGDWNLVSYIAPGYTVSYCNATSNFFMAGATNSITSHPASNLNTFVNIHAGATGVQYLSSFVDNNVVLFGGSRLNYAVSFDGGQSFQSGNESNVNVHGSNTTYATYGVGKAGDYYLMLTGHLDLYSSLNCNSWEFVTQLDGLRTYNGSTIQNFIIPTSDSNTVLIRTTPASGSNSFIYLVSSIPESPPTPSGPSFKFLKIIAPALIGD